MDFHGRYTAGAGSAIYTARNFPKEYWNRVQFVAEPTGHLLGKFHLEARGADFISHNGRNFAASDDEWTGPVCAEVGPDGALWVSDWYNYIIQHNPTPRGFRTGKGAAYETPLRDKTHGRIYRIAYVAASRKNAADYRSTLGLPREMSAALFRDAATGQQLVSALKNDKLRAANATQGFERLTAAEQEMLRPLRMSIDMWMGHTTPEGHHRFQQLLKRYFTPSTVNGTRSKRGRDRLEPGGHSRALDLARAWRVDGFRRASERRSPGRLATSIRRCASRRSNGAAAQRSVAWCPSRHQTARRSRRAGSPDGSAGSVRNACE